MNRLIRNGVARSFVLAAAIIASVTLFNPSLGSAATLAPGLRFCFVYSNDHPYASQPVFLYWFDGKQARYWKAGRSGPDGCGTFRDVVPNVHYWVRATWTLRTHFQLETWSGDTGWTFVGAASNRAYEATHATVFQTLPR